MFTMINTSTSGGVSQAGLHIGPGEARGSSPTVIDTESEPSVDRVMTSEGWEQMGRGSWIKTFYDASAMQVPPIGRLRRRITRDSSTGELIKDLHL